jgi:glycine oxidase
MTADFSTDVLILGKGVIGLSAARELAIRNPDLSIAILEAPTSAMAASRAAAGMLSPAAEFGTDSPLGRLGVESLGMYPDFVRSLEEESGLDLGLRWDGTLIPDIEVQREEFEAKLYECRNADGEYRLLEGDDLRTAEPGLNDTIKRALWLPEGVLNSCRLHDALIASARKRGVAIVEGIPISVERTGDHIQAVVLQDGRRIELATLIAATGAWTDDIAEILGLQFDIRPVKGQVARMQCPDGFVRHIFHLQGFYMAPRVGAGVLLGSTMEDVGFDASISEEVIARFIRQARQLFPALVEFDVVETWAGFRPRSTDGMPIIGWISNDSNVLVATGHFRNGILLTPITGHMIAEMYADPEAALWTEFSAQRPSLLKNADA